MAPRPDATAVVSRVSQAAIVAATLAVLGSDLATAFVVAVGFAGLTLGGDVLAVVVGDYAEHVLLGALGLGLAGWLLVVDGPSIAAGAFAALGAWLVVDGVQHLRHGVDRKAVPDPYSHDGGAVTGLLRVLWRRLLRPFRL